MKTCTDDGFIRLHRSMLKWEWFTDVNTCALFVYLLLSANWQDTRYKGKTIKRGQLLVTVSQLGETLNMTPKQIRIAFEHLKKTGELKCTSWARNGTLVTVEKYDFYQSEKPTEGKQRANKRANKGQIKGKQNGSLLLTEKKLINKEINNVYCLLSDDEVDELMSHVSQEDELELSDELLKASAEGINNPYKYAVGVAKNLGMWRD